MGIMDQMRTANMFSRGGTPPPGRGDRGGDGGRDRNETPRNRVIRQLTKALKQQPRRSGWTPYTGSSRFANWSPIERALMG